MTWSHFGTICWLRWRLMVNQLRRMSSANRIVTIVALVLGCIASTVLFFLSWLAGSHVLNQLNPSTLMLVWTGLGAAFLFGWSIGVLTDLQRSEPLSLDKFLSLPVSARGAFLMNYLSSFFSIAIFLMLPVLVGFCFSMIEFYGWTMGTGLLLLAAFVLLVTALTYQFRGWMATLMVNKRHKRALIAGLMFVFIMVMQVPNFLNLTVFEDREAAAEQRKVQQSKMKDEWRSMVNDEEMTQAEFDERVEELEAQNKAKREREIKAVADVVRIGNMVFPPGWMPLGIEAAAKRQWWLPPFCLLGLLGLSGISLYRSFITTLRLYRGDIARHKPTAKQKDKQSERPLKMPLFHKVVGRDIPMLNQHQSAVATGMLASVARAPEAKLALFGPFLVMLIVGVSLVFRAKTPMPLDFRPFAAIGVCTFAMLGVLTMIQNQFGYDRGGFRIFVLSPVRRREILIGKNAALAPFAFFLGIMGLGALQIFMPLRPTHLLAAIVQLGSVYLITCMFGNMMSIIAPLAIASGTMKPMNMNMSVILLQLLIMILLPLALLPTMIPLIAELLLREVYGWGSIPVYLLGSVLVFIATLGVYLWVVSRQGRVLRDKEQDILSVVTQVGT